MNPRKQNIGSDNNSVKTRLLNNLPRDQNNILLRSLSQVMHNLVDLSDLYFSEKDIEKMWVVIYYLIRMVFTINEKLYWNFPLILETNDSVGK